MEKKLDTSWFDLKKYEGLKALDLYGWERQITKRRHIREFFDIFPQHQLAAILFENIKDCPIIEEDDERGRERWGKWRKSDANHPYNTNSVFSVPADSLKLFSDSLLRLESPNHALRYIFNDLSYRDKATLSEVQHDLPNHDIDRAKFSEAQSDLPRHDIGRVNFYSPITPITSAMRDESLILPNDTPSIGGDRGSYQNTTAVMIDLSANDEQIKRNFAHWLSEFRKTKKYPAVISNKKMDFTGWVDKRLLPYIDLMIAAELVGLTLGHVQAANLIFPGFSGNIDNKIRRTTKTKADWLMEEETLLAIQAQLRSMPSK